MSRLPVRHAPIVVAALSLSLILSRSRSSWAADAPAGQTPDVTKSAGAGAGDPEEEYLRRYVHFGEFIGIQAGTNVVVSQWSVPFKGKYDQPLSGADFYREIDRPDLAARFQHTQNIRIGFWVTGLVMIVGGTAWAMASSKSDGSGSSGDILLVGLVGGTIVGCVPMFIDPHPISMPEAREQVDIHNKKLRESLGGGAPPGQTTSGRTEARSSWRDRLQLQVGLFGAGAALGGRF